MQNIEKAVLVGLVSPAFDEFTNSSEKSLDELCELLDTAGGQCVCKVLQNLQSPNAKTLIGSGKLQEIIDICDKNDADLIIFDNELSPSKLKNIEEITGKYVLDRSNLILDIFAKRAISLEGKLQVELAQYKYILPRIIGLGKSMSRLSGKIGTRGPGESKLESDRRHIRRRIERLEAELSEVLKNRETMRKSRLKSKMPKVSIVGYTNAGKSTLLNKLTNANIEANNRLFDTLDTTTRKLKISDTLEIFLTDTVGFISKLPHHLINAFKASLEELTYADLLLLVVDVSDENYKDHIKTVSSVIKNLGADKTDIITVYNKIDLTENENLPDDGVLVSLKNNIGISKLLLKIEQTLNKDLHLVNIIIPFCEGYVIDFIHKSANVKSELYTESGTELLVECDEEIYQKIKKYQKKD